MSLDQHMKPRVIPSILPNYTGKNVSLIGIAKNVDTSGNFFTLSFNGKDVKIVLQQPLGQPVSGLVEVYGMVKSDNTIICDEFVVLPGEMSESFDLSFYQKVVEYTQRCSTLYLQGGNVED